MALSSIIINITNDYAKGYMVISSTKKTTVSENINYVLISRRKHGINNNYEMIYEKAITSPNQLSFTYYDMTTRSGTSYDYYISLADNNTPSRTIIEFGNVNNIECWFDGLFIGNNSKQYLAPLNCSTNTTRNTQANYVTTLSSRTPYRVSNSNVNYTTGQSSALFTPLDANNQPTLQSTKEYIEEVVDFLNDGTEKILKTHDGEMWYVSIDPGVNVSHDDYYTGSSKIDFNWTEIGDVPIKKVVSA